MAVKVDQETCIGCGACVGTCPVGTLDYIDEGQAACDSDTCISCLACVGTCPVEAISEE